MELIEDVENNRDKIQNAINKFGYAPEHNADWFLYYTGKKQQPIFISWPDGNALLTHKQSNAWYTFSEPLAAEAQRGQRVAEFAGFIFSNYHNVKKIVVESRTNTKKQILESLPKTLKARPIYYTLIWPIMNMEQFDPMLSGSHFKSLRNAKNKFYKEHKVEIRKAHEVPKDQLHNLINNWQKILLDKKVKAIHEVSYHNMINGDFAGTKSARVMFVDDKLAGLNAGWNIPNSDIFYAAVGIHDYSWQDLGSMLYLEDLEWIKNAGYHIADMGGVEKGPPLNFKNQFLPERWYKTYVFSIVKNNRMC